MESQASHPLHTIQKEKWIILILAALQFLHVLDFVIMMPLGPQFMSQFHIGSAEFGLLVSSYSISAGILGMIGALFLDRLDRKWTLLGTFAGFAFGTFLCAISRSYPFFLFARIVAGGFGGMIGATVLSIIGDIIPVFRRGAATGAVMSAFSVASVVGIPIGLYLANLYGWYFPFLILAILSFLMLPFAYLTLPAIRSHLDTGLPKRSQITALKEVLTSTNHYPPFLFMLFLMFGGFTVIPFIAPYLVANVGLTKEELPYVYFFGGLFTFFTSQWIGKLADRFGKFNVYLSVTTLSLLPIVIVTSLGNTPLIIVLIITTLFMVLVSGRMVPAFALVTSAVPSRIRGSFMSVNSSIQQIASGLASSTAGWILYRNHDGSFENYEFVGMLSILSLVISVFVAKRIKLAKN